jgi:hypothetical protein
MKSGLVSLGICGTMFLLGRWDFASFAAVCVVWCVGGGLVGAFDDDAEQPL